MAVAAKRLTIVAKFQNYTDFPPNLMLPLFILALILGFWKLGKRRDGGGILIVATPSEQMGHVPLQLYLIVHKN